MRLIDATRIEQFILNNCSDTEEINTIYAKLINAPTIDAVSVCDAESASMMSEWIPIKTRPMDDDERRIWSEKLGYDIEYDEAVIFVSKLPDDGQEVLTCDKWGRVRSDTFFNDGYGCYLEDNGDMDGIVAWMPLPEPYGERSTEESSTDERRADERLHL